MGEVGIEALPGGLQAALVEALPGEAREALLLAGRAAVELVLAQPASAERLRQALQERAAPDRRSLALAGLPMRAVLEEAVRRALERSGGDRSRAARELGAARSTVIGYANRLGLPTRLAPPPERPGPPRDDDEHLALPGRPLRAVWREAIRRAVRRHGDKASAARALGISRSTVLLHCRPGPGLLSSAG